MIAEDLYSTALSLKLIRDNRRQKIFEYLVNRRVWRHNHTAARLALEALVEFGEAGTAREFLALCRQDLEQSPDKGSRGFCEELSRIASGKRKDAWGGYVSKLFFFSVLPISAWNLRTSLLYDYLPEAAFSLESAKKQDSEKILTALAGGLNLDGSYGGITPLTMMAGYVLNRLGDVESSAKAERWVDSVYNGNGSFAPQGPQDVFDTGWACLALGQSGERVPDQLLDWIDSTQIAGGYPYYSGSYFPDTWDTALMVLAKLALGLDEGDFAQNVHFLLRTQNPDGGWGINPIAPLSYAFPSKVLFRILHRSYWSSPLARRLLRMMWIRANQVSNVDATAKVLITLGQLRRFKHSRKVKADGAAYLQRWFTGYRFYHPLRWFNSDFSESGLAALALSRLDIAKEKTAATLAWLSTQPFVGADEAGHLLWAGLEGGFTTKMAARVAEYIVGSQNEDGAWDPSIGILTFSRYRDPVFSNAVPLFALSSYRTKVEGTA